MHNTATKALLQRIDGPLWLTDGGLETAMIFLEGIDLPEFASFPLLADRRGRAALTAYFDALLDLAARHRTGFVLDTATWRASHGWGAVMGLTAAEIDAANREAVTYARGLAAKRPRQPVVVNGVVGPFGDAYAPHRVLSLAEARDYHARQVRVLAAEGVDLVTAVTMTSPAEAAAIGQLAAEAGLPFALSFTVETDGRLIGGQTLAGAIAEAEAATGGQAAWFGVNCAHPDHFRGALAGDWTGRIGMIRANASRKSHAELDRSTELDAGDPAELGRDYAALRALLPELRIVGGCCGTDLRHISAIGHQCCRAAA